VRYLVLLKKPAAGLCSGLWLEYERLLNSLFNHAIKAVISLTNIPIIIYHAGVHFVSIFSASYINNQEIR